MSLVINHNLMAMNANRNLAMAYNSLSTSTSRRSITANGAIPAAKAAAGESCLTTMSCAHPKR